MRTWAWLLILPPLLVQAAVYRYTDEEGNVVYSDQPAPGAEEIDVQAPSTYEPPPRPAAEEPSAAPQPAADEQPYTRFELLQPEDQGTIWSQVGDVEVRLALEPGLRPEHRIVLVLDGEPLDVDVGGATRLQLTGVTRDTHTLAARIENEAGEPVAVTSSVTFYLKHHDVPRGQREPATGRQPYIPPSAPPPSDGGNGAGSGGGTAGTP
ncbi:MAG: DUF4124 domain-containing protein [Gammaproteobacteria bacterium]|nr:DUF4124 domain-containing protein [Gammaproteobacteria bacterium]